MRITRVRVAVQTVSVLMFLGLLYVTCFSRLKGFPVSVYLKLDPLVALSTALATHRVYQDLLWSLLIIVPTLLLGRFFCNWVCPMGALMQFTGWLFDARTAREKIAANQFGKLQQIKYYILVFMLVAALCGTLQSGLLDPIPTVYRSFSTVVLPVADQALDVAGVGGELLYRTPRYHQYAWLIAGLLIFFLGMNLLKPRFFCRVLCPLGALLGWLSRFSLWRIHINEDLCVECGRCSTHCEGACEPSGALRQAECFVCMNCLKDCHTGAITYAWLPPRDSAVLEPQVNRRRLIFAGLLGALLYPISRLTGRVDRNFDPRVIRPPGSVAEPEFLERCIKCDQCIRVCPTNVLQPAMWEAGLEGLWTPLMVHRIGWCELNCTLCGQICPTGAIQKISIAQKRGQGEFAEAGPITVGTAFYDRGRCLPWGMDTPCVVCEEVCPVSPKAIYTREVRIGNRSGEPVDLKRPYVDPNLCIGCGTCTHECPVVDSPAVYVTAVGETRSKERSLLLGGRRRQESAELHDTATRTSASCGKTVTEFTRLTDLVDGSQHQTRG